VITFGEVARRAGGWLPLIGLAGLAGGIGTLALPTVLGHAVDALITGHSSVFWVVIAGTLIALNVALDVVDAYAGTACVAGTTAWLRDRVVRHVLAIGPSRSGQFETGDLVTRVSGSAVEAAQAGPAAVTTLSASLPPIGSLVLLALIDPWLALALLAGLALVVGVLRTFALRSTEVMVAYQRTQGTIAARLAESLGGARTIAAAGTAGAEERRVLADLPELHEHGVGTWNVLARSSAQATLVGPLVLVAVLAAGGIELLRGEISPGELFAASQYAVIGGGLGTLTGVFSRLARAKAGVRRVGEVLAAEPLSYGTASLPDGPGTVEFRGVTVRAGDAVLLEDVQLTVPGGAAVAVVGASGAGKSVLAEVAARLRTPDEGEILLDGVALAELDHDSLRTAVGCAFERPVLVGASIGDAVAAGREVDVRASARAMHADEFVNRLPDGYATPLSEAPMSGGEYQRLGLARAWPAQRLLVLDDATSSVDMVTEMQIARTLTDDHGGRTRLIVTHRAATAAHADLVVWLVKGKVAATGTHDELWARPGYREVFG